MFIVKTRAKFIYKIIRLTCIYIYKSLDTPVEIRKRVRAMRAHIVDNHFILEIHFHQTQGKGGKTTLLVRAGTSSRRWSFMSSVGRQSSKSIQIDKPNKYIPILNATIGILFIDNREL